MSEAPVSSLAVVPAQTFVMGSDRHYSEGGPSHPVQVDEVAMDVHQVTNARVAAFVDETGHVRCVARRTA